uniref:Uncharacterized protein n=1 Tax=Populus trichocarpa TaxID=3694 RepID=B9HG64_POPTR
MACLLESTHDKMYGGLFNFVIEDTFMFTPSFFTACKSDKYRWSLDVLQGFQMFLTHNIMLLLSLLSTFFLLSTALYVL